ncbi:hypothetical protein D0469_14015 [Peribacillus saganii]|uniref:Uncharacterized protein n=1 Tax=Peribacillus saganii TaxID=2303992 RepID=A0A372LLC0_9BACI|nr:hypothetical protein D0469_14015 [Peribacillus saganii]
MSRTLELDICTYYEGYFLTLIKQKCQHPGWRFQFIEGQKDLAGLKPAKNTCSFSGKLPVALFFELQALYTVFAG